MLTRSQALHHLCLHVLFWCTGGCTGNENFQLKFYYNFYNNDDAYVANDYLEITVTDQASEHVCLCYKPTNITLSQ
jgi:hypothetical protein